MSFSENISLQKYVDSANQQFNECENRLSEIESSFQTRMDGKTTGSLVVAILGTVCWLVAFCVFFWYIRGYVDSTISLVCLGVAVALVISLFIDEIIGFSYYGKISSYKNNIAQLSNRVRIGRNSIRSNQDAFMKSRANGWHHPLSVGTSISEEAMSIESTMNSLESLKVGFINGLKNFLFYTFVISITGVGSWMLFGTVGDLISGVSGESLESDILMPLCVIGLLIAEVGEVILAKMLWSHTDCTVTNTTLWVAPLGPVLFLLLAVVATVVVMLVIWLVSAIIAIISLCIALAVGAAVISGMSGG